MTGYRRWLNVDKQQRANSWMLMTGSLGMLASTLPVQWLLPSIGWRWMFVILAVLLLLSMWLMRWQVPQWRLPETAPIADASSDPKPSVGILASYAPVWQNAYFRSLVPMGFFSYGGLVAMQTLWAGPWMVKVCGYTPLEAATGLFWVNVSMMVTFWLWGLVTPHLYARGLDANRLISYGVPLNFLVQLYIVTSGAEAGALAWALFCMTTSVIALSQPAVGMAFPPALVGRGLSAYNLVVFLGVFVVQWGVGLMVDGFTSQGLEEPQAFRAAIAVYFACCVFAYVHFLRHKSDGG
jgi:predicted MFS family arabinose efflux permease